MLKDQYTPDELRAVLTPLASLISKSEKAQQKLAPGTWQHTMLGENLKALRYGYALLSGEPVDGCMPEELDEMLTAFSSMIDRTEKAFGMFEPGTSQHTLQRNRLNALRIAEARLKSEMEQEHP